MTWKSRINSPQELYELLVLVKGDNISQVQVESLRQELSEKQSLLSEAGEAIEQLENKIKLQEDLSKKVKECSGQYIKIYEIGFYTFIRTFLSLKMDKVVEGKI